MTRVINRVLNSHDLPIAELCAARLDGEVYSVDECFAAIDEVDTVVVRAIAVRSAAPRAVIAELSTAAWILGVVATPPARHRFSVDVSHRSRTPQSNRFLIRECVFKPGDVSLIAGFRVTTPLRTAIDLLRISPEFDSEQGRVVSGLLGLQALTASECLRRIKAYPSTPGSRRAIERLSSLKPASGLEWATAWPAEPGSVRAGESGRGASVRLQVGAGQCS